MNGSAPVTATKGGRRLVLHFDINKTIVMKDTTSNVNNSTLTVSTLIVNILGVKPISRTLLGKDVC